MGLHDVRLAHIANPEHETQVSIALADDCVAAEEQGLSTFLGAGQFGEHDAHHEGLYHHSHYALQTHHEYCLWTLLSRVSRAVPETPVP